MAKYAGYSILTAGSLPNDFLETVYWIESGTYEFAPYYLDPTGSWALWNTSGGYYVMSAFSDFGGSPTDFINIVGWTTSGIQTGSHSGEGAWSGSTMSFVAGSFVLSEWEWSSINRNRDYSFIRNREFYRENWTISRYRYGNTPYASQLGETESSALSAYNAGVPEQVTPPTFPAFYFQNNFSTGTNWKSYGLAWDIFSTGEVTDVTGIPFYKAAWEHRSRPVYISNAYTPVHSGEVMVVLWDDVSIYGLANFDDSNWHLITLPVSQAESGIFPDDVYGNTGAIDWINNQIATVTGASPYHYIIGWDNGSGLPTDSSPELADYFEEGTSTIPFRCVSDYQAYESRGVDWFKQTQVWEAKSPWS